MKRALILCALLVFTGPSLANDVEVAKDLLERAALDCDQERDLFRAERDAARALAILESTLGPGNADVGNALVILGRIYRGEGRIDDSITALKRGLETLERSPHERPSDVASALLELATTYRVQDRLDEALPLLTRSLTLAQGVHGNTHPLIASILLEMSHVHMRQKRAVAAERSAADALAIYEKSLGSAHFRTGMALAALAKSSETTNRPDSEVLYKRALAILEATLGPDAPSVGTILIHLSDMYRRNGQADEADRLRTRSLQILEKSLGPDHPDVAAAYSAAAHGYQLRGMTAGAEDAYLRSISIYEKVMKWDPVTAGTLSDLSSLYAKNGRLARELQVVRRISRINQPRFDARSIDDLGPDDAAFIRRGLFRHLALLSLNPAEDATDELVEESFRIAQLVQLNSIEAAIAKMAVRLTMRDDALGSMMRERQELALRRRELEREILADASRPLSAQDVDARRRLAAQADQVDARIRDVDAEIRTRFPQFDVLASSHPLQVRDAQSALDPDEALIVLVSPASVSVSGARRRARLTAAAGWIELKSGLQPRHRVEAGQELFEGDFLFAGPNSRAAIVFDDGSRLVLDQNTQMQLKSRSQDDRAARFGRTWNVSKSAPGARFTTPAALAAIRGGPDSGAWRTPLAPDLGYNAWAWIVRRDAAAFVPLKVGLYELAQEVANTRDTILPDADGRFTRTLNVRGLHRIYSAVFAPLEPHLKGVKHLLLAPSGAMESLPFNMLVATPPAEIRRLEDLRQVDWLVRKYAISVLPSVGSLGALRRLDNGSRAPDPFGGFGDPLLDDADAKGQRRTIAVNAVFPASDELSPARRQLAIANVEAIKKAARLPETAAELRAMARALGAQDDVVWLGERATETTVKNTDLSRFRILAFATHGVTAGELTGVGEPGLILTPPAIPTAMDDGYLAMSEIAALKLDADWVVLSACNTAAPDGSPGAPGFSGLAKAFLYAGSRALLVSHWPVDSDATMLLTTAILRDYGANPTAGKARAHQKAMLSLIDNAAPRFSHPFFWAPFVVVGEGKSIH